MTLSPNAAGLLRLLLVLVSKKIVDIDKSKRCQRENTRRRKLFQELHSEWSFCKRYRSVEASCLLAGHLLRHGQKD